MNQLQILKEHQVGFGILLESDAGFIDVNNKFNEKILKESIENPKVFLENPIVHCVLQRYDIPNKNGRIYPKNILLNAVENYMPNVKQNSATGETDHADNTNISLMNVGLVIKDIYWEGNACMGVVLLPITKGFKEMGICSNSADIVANLLLHNVLTGISSRSIGSVQQNGKYKEVQNDLELLCWDHVSVPSTPKSYLYTQKEDALANVPYEDPNFKQNVQKINKPTGNDSMQNKLKKFLSTKY